MTSTILENKGRFGSATLVSASKRVFFLAGSGVIENSWFNYDIWRALLPIMELPIVKKAKTEVIIILYTLTKELGSLFFSLTKLAIICEQLRLWKLLLACCFQATISPQFISGRNKPVQLSSFKRIKTFKFQIAFNSIAGIYWTRIWKHSDQILSILMPSSNCNLALIK